MLPSRLLGSAGVSPIPPATTRSSTGSSLESSTSSLGRASTTASPSQPSSPPEITTAELISDLSTLFATAQSSSQSSSVCNVVSLPSSSASRRSDVDEDPTLHKVREVLKFQSVISEKQAQFQPSERSVNHTISPPPSIANGRSRMGGMQRQDALELAVAEVERDVLMMLDRMKQSGLDVNESNM
ncbi:hypothetical protein LIPSTDRAFT_63886 [Lipomyces starkeyi NRRL Y-11557]|uniref:Uncharacterized protein n=1 Tax=Lipomyces starkeyi NRRL Y-11557 TaxID=675824 RepID=A0A1E3Q4L0_LIPST|nr:hypothetical protein LIPSTDRAFT_63886 [Lipomyces starkeyi NRRL Y-11557]